MAPRGGACHAAGGVDADAAGPVASWPPHCASPAGGPSSGERGPATGASKDRPVVADYAARSVRRRPAANLSVEIPCHGAATVGDVTQADPMWNVPCRGSRPPAPEPACPPRRGAPAGLPLPLRCAHPRYAPAQGQAHSSAVLPPRPAAQAHRPVPRATRCGAGQVFGQDGRPHAHPAAGGSSRSNPTYASARISP